MQAINKQLLETCYKYALDQEVGFLDSLSTLGFSGEYPQKPSWAIGPFAKEDKLTFHLKNQWNDPTGIGWKAGFLFNASLIVKDNRLYLFYRVSPKKESLSSRIGVAYYEQGIGWTDYDNNPIIYPTFDNETFGCEDPKVYYANGHYYMYYNSTWPTDGTEELSTYFSDGYAVGAFGSDINVAVSDDLFHWEKKGKVIDYPVSRLWAKGAVIPRNPQGEAVKINGEYLMFISEGCGGKQHVGHSIDMIHWNFVEQSFLDISEFGNLFEVACAVVDHDKEKTDLILDFFYRDKEGICRAGQARYLKEKPFQQLALNRGGTLAWGGLLQFERKWLFAQGWDAKDGDLELYFYTADSN